MPDKPDHHCSFCKLPASEVGKLVRSLSSEGNSICNRCIDSSYYTIHENDPPTQTRRRALNGDPSETPPPVADVVLSPREMKLFLDEYVVGQDQAKEALCVAVYNHYKRLRGSNDIIMADDTQIEKSNTLMIGPSGSGKTYLIQTIARKLNVPFIVADATSLTEAGYVGEDVESIIGRLLHVAGNDVKKCETGIVFLDEIDKKARRSPINGGRDVSGEGVQQALLKLLEGSDVMVAPPGMKKSSNVEMIKINTTNILFFLGGAFVGLDSIVDKTKEETSIGFGASVVSLKRKIGDVLRGVEPEHLVTFGLIPELVGRIPVITILDELDEEQLIKIISTPKNSLVKQFQKLFAFDGIEVVFDEDALREVAKIAIKRKMGGRALRSVLEKCLMKTQFDLPDLKISGVTKILVSGETITGKNISPKLFYGVVPEVQVLEGG